MRTAEEAILALEKLNEKQQNQLTEEKYKIQ
jgi:hypothetical protein